MPGGRPPRAWTNEEEGLVFRTTINRQSRIVTWDFARLVWTLHNGRPAAIESSKRLNPGQLQPPAAALRAIGVVVGEEEDERPGLFPGPARPGPARPGFQTEIDENRGPQLGLAAQTPKKAALSQIGIEEIEVDETASLSLSFDQIAETPKKPKQKKATFLSMLARLSTSPSSSSSASTTVSRRARPSRAHPRSSHRMHLAELV